MEEFKAGDKVIVIKEPECNRYWGGGYGKGTEGIILQVIEEDHTCKFQFKSEPWVWEGLDNIELIKKG